MSKIDLSQDKEVARLAALARYHILDSLPERVYDDITLLASQICGTPISLISFVSQDRQWFKSHRGWEVKETARSASFCTYLVGHPEQPLIVPDARKDYRFKGNPLVTSDPKIIFYAGIPLTTPDGHTLGSLCVIDRKAREISDEQVGALKALANLVIQQLELRLKLQEVEAQQRLIEGYNEELEQFAYALSHDIKGPLGNVHELFRFFIADYQDRIPEEGRNYLHLIDKNLDSLRGLVDDLLEYHTTVNKLDLAPEPVILNEIIDQVVERIKPGEGIKILYPSEPVPHIHTIPVAIEQILYNLITNAIKYNDSEEVEVRISYVRAKDYHRVDVSDNGRGITPEDVDKIFQVFQTLQTTDRYQNQGTGIGLAIIRNLLQKLDGKIEVHSELGIGSTFRCYFRV